MEKSLGKHNAKPVLAVALSLTLFLTMALSSLLYIPAYADTKSELDALKAQSESIFASINALQDDLNKANSELSSATAEHEQAVKAMNDAKKKVIESEARISDLQGKLSGVASNMYKSGGSASFLEVIIGSSTFSEFVNNWDMVSRIGDRNAELIQETKGLRDEAKAAHKEFESQRQIAEDKMNEALAAKSEIVAKESQLSQQAFAISSEVAELEAQMELEAEAAHQAEAEAVAKAAQAEEAAKAAARAAQAASMAYAASLSAGSSVDSGSGIFANPCPTATQSSGWGYRTFDNSFHKGTDMAAPMGTPFYAAEAGTVIYAANNGGYNGGAGNWVVISHGNGLVTKYMHASAIFVSVGDHVERGQNIGAVGSTGNSTGPHLHFQVEYEGVAVCPYDFL